MPKIVINKDEVSLEPVSEDTVAISKGEAPKSFLSDGRHLYILKKPKKRTFIDIFGESFPLLLAWTFGNRA